jgi:SAM-dependent methyltransferase
VDHEAEIVGYYEDRYEESARLSEPAGQLEFLRTTQILSRHLTATKLRIADVGGGPGIYTEWLARRGHEVTLIDPVERHVADARRRVPGLGTVHAVVGDAREIDLDDESMDIVLLLGPLYHLLERSDRAQALAEARRVLRPGGRAFAAGISRFASVHDGLGRRFLLDPEFADIVASDLASGRHVNAGRRPSWFTSAYFHRPDELGAEVAAAGFVEVAVLGVEGLAGWFPDLGDRLADDHERTVMLDFLARVESEPSLLGVSAHLLAHGRKPAPGG